MNDASSTWKYPKLPNTWWWVGGGGTQPVIGGNNTKKKYKYEEQFSGSLANYTKTKNLLEKIFDNLKKKEIIKYYRIADKYIYKD